MVFERLKGFGLCYLIGENGNLIFWKLAQFSNILNLKLCQTVQSWCFTSFLPYEYVFEIHFIWLKGILIVDWTMHSNGSLILLVEVALSLNFPLPKKKSSTLDLSLSLLKVKASFFLKTTSFLCPRDKRTKNLANIWRQSLSLWRNVPIKLLEIGTLKKRCDCHEKVIVLKWRVKPL